MCINSFKIARLVAEYWLLKALESDLVAVVKAKLTLAECLSLIGLDSKGCGK
jgi:hypothetical protein